MGRLVAFLASLLVCTVSASAVVRGYDELAENSADAEAYAQYMAVTEASAPLVRVHHHRYGHRHPSSTSTFFKNRNSFPSDRSASLTTDKYPTLGRSVVYQWSSWSSWSSCSRTCDGGIMTRHRSCRREYARISPGSGIRSSYQQCFGESSEYSLCNQNSCPPSDQDFRQYQCSLYNNRTIQGFYVSSWMPNTGSHQCELNCRAEGFGFSYTFGKALDGTRCTLNAAQPKNDLCINGRCLPIGCDGRIGSYRKFDMCNVCGGKNNTCSHVAAVAFPNNPLINDSDTPDYSPVVRIPRGATNVRMTDNSTNYLALMDDEHQYFLNGNRVIDWPGVYKTAGDVFSYDRSKDFESISTNGPLNKDVIVTVLVRDRNRGFFYEYWYPNQSYPRLSSFHGGDHSDSYVISTAHSPPSEQSKKSSTAAPAERILINTTPSTTTARMYQADMENYEPQPTAASLIRHPPRISHRTIFAQETFVDSIRPKLTTAAPMTQAPRTRSKNVKSSRLKAKITHPPKSFNATLALNDKIKQVKPSKAVGKRGKSAKDAQVCGSRTACWKTVNGKKHFCNSDFVFRCRVLSYEVINEETRYEVQVIQSYKNVIPILNREFIWVEPLNCPCPYLRLGSEYIIMGTTDRSFRRNEVRLHLNQNSYVRIYNQMNDARVMRIRRNEANYCKKYKNKFKSSKQIQE